MDLTIALTAAAIVTAAPTLPQVSTAALCQEVRSAQEKAAAVDDQVGQAVWQEIRQSTLCTRDELPRLNQLMDSDNPRHVYYLGFMRLYGVGLPQERELAHGHFKQAARLGQWEGERMADYLYSVESLLLPYPVLDPVRRNQMVMEQAEGGNTTAQTLLGLYYFHGDAGFERNYQLSRQWTARAAQKGDEMAMALLAEPYPQGLNTETRQASLGGSAPLRLAGLR